MGNAGREGVDGGDGTVGEGASAEAGEIEERLDDETGIDIGIAGGFKCDEGDFLRVIFAGLRGVAVNGGEIVMGHAV